MYTFVKIGVQLENCLEYHCPIASPIGLSKKVYDYNVTFHIQSFLTTKEPTKTKQVIPGDTELGMHQLQQPRLIGPSAECGTESGDK